MLTLLCFIVVALLWLCRDPQFVPGWGALFPTESVTASCHAALGGEGGGEGREGGADVYTVIEGLMSTLSYSPC